MKKKRKISVPGRYLFAGLALLCIFMMGVSYIVGFTGGPVKTVAGMLFVPIQKGVNEAGLQAKSAADNLESLQKVQAENEALQARIDELIQENNRLQEERYELTELRELFNLNETYGNYEKIAARVIGKDSGNWYSTFIIDKGTADGIKVDMNVIAGSGLVGIVEKTGRNWSQVRSIIDDVSYVSATVLSTSDPCFIAGDLSTMSEGVIRITQLKTKEGMVQKGDKILTSHISSKFQEGILIGYVDTVEPDSNGLTYSGTMTPAVNFDYLHTVLVITDLKQTAAED